MAPPSASIPKPTPAESKADSDGAAASAPSEALKPESIPQEPPVKPMPQATIKLQVAPAPASSLKSAPPVTTTKEAGTAPQKPASLTPVIEEKEEEAGDEDAAATSGIPLPLLIAAAALALLAFGIQIWTYLS
jgi:hypothetical protein